MLLEAGAQGEKALPKITVVDPDRKPLLVQTLAQARALAPAQRNVAVVEYSIPDEEYLDFFKVLAEKKVTLHLRIHTSNQRRQHKRGKLLEFLQGVPNLKHLTVYTRSPRCEAMWDGLGELKSLETLYFWDIG